MSNLVEYFNKNLPQANALRKGVAENDDQFQSLDWPAMGSLAITAARTFANVEATRAWIETHLPAVESVSGFPEAQPTRAPHGLDVTYTNGSADLKLLMRVVGHMKLTGEAVGTLLSSVSGLYRSYAREFITPPRKLTDAEADALSTRVQTDVYRVGPYLFRHKFEVDQVAGTTAIDAKGKVTTTFANGFSFEWVNGSFKLADRDSLTAELSTRLINGKKVQIVSCSRLVPAYTAFMSACRLTRSPSTKRWELKQAPVDHMSPAHIVFRQSDNIDKFNLLIAELATVLNRESSEELVHNQIQLFIMDHVGDTSQFLFEALDKLNVGAGQAAAHVLKSMTNLSQRGSTMADLATMVKEIATKDANRNDGGRAKLFNGNASYYGDAFPELANYARYAALAQELARLFPDLKKYTCKSDSDAVHLHNALTASGLTAANWQSTARGFSSLEGLPLGGGGVILDTYTRQSGAPKDGFPALDNFHQLVALGDQAPRVVVFPLKSDRLVSQGAVKCSALLNALPTDWGYKAVKGGKFHTSDFYLIAYKGIKEASTPHLLVMGVMKKFIQIAWAFEQSITASTAYGVRLKTNVGFAEIASVMRAVKTGVDTKGQPITRPFAWDKDAHTRAYLGSIEYKHTGHGLSTAEEVIPDIDSGNDWVGVALPAADKISTHELEALPVVASKSSSSSSSSVGVNPFRYTAPSTTVPAPAPDPDGADYVPDVDDE